MRDLIPLNNVLPERMNAADEAAQRGMMDLVKWCIRNERLIQQGRSYGFRMAVSPAIKDLIAVTCPDRATATRINASLLDVAG
jgi:hypothetical protein